MNYIKSSVLGVVVLFVLFTSALSFAAKRCVYPGFSASYILYGKSGNAIGSIDRLLTLNKDSTFQFVSKLQAKVLFFKETVNTISKGKYSHQGLFPNTVHVSESRHHMNKTLSLKPGVYDGGSYILQLRHDILSGKQLFNYTVELNNKKITYKFSKKGLTKIESPIGAINALLLESQPINNLVSRLWFDQDNGYFLVKTEQLKDGRVIASSIINHYSRVNNSRCAY